MFCYALLAFLFFFFFGTAWMGSGIMTAIHMCIYYVFDTCFVVRDSSFRLGQLVGYGNAHDECHTTGTVVFIG